MDEDILKLVGRIKATADGLDFLEYLKTLSRENYQAFKKDGQAMNDIHKGYAVAIDALVETFENCEELLQKMAAEKDRPDPAVAHY